VLGRAYKYILEFFWVFSETVFVQFADEREINLSARIISQFASERVEKNAMATAEALWKTCVPEGLVHFRPCFPVELSRLAPNVRRGNPVEPLKIGSNV